MLVPFEKRLKDIALKIKEITYKLGLIADYDVEIGAASVGDDVWHYRKKASGYAECWAWVNRSCSGWAAWGYNYYANVAAINYPFEFEEIPIQTIDVTTGAGSYWNVNYMNTVTNTSTLQMTRNNSNPGTLPCRVHIQLYGKLISKE